MNLDKIPCHFEFFITMVIFKGRGIRLIVRVHRICSFCASRSPSLSKICICISADDNSQKNMKPRCWVKLKTATTKLISQIKSLKKLVLVAHLRLHTTCLVGLCEILEPKWAFVQLVAASKFCMAVRWRGVA